jgi:hypothetical protein
MLIFAGLLTIFANPFALALFVFFLFLQYHFIVLAEESFLVGLHGPGYREYCRRIRRWLPRFDRWLAPSGRFDWKKVFFKENDSGFNLLFGALLILAWKERYFSEKIRRPLFFAGAGLALILFYAWVKILKKKHAAKSAA